MRKVYLITDHPNINSGLAHVGRMLAEFLNREYQFTYFGLHSSTAQRTFPYRVVDNPKFDFGCALLPQLLAEELPEVIITVGGTPHFSYLPSIKTRAAHVWIAIITIDSTNYVGGIPLSWQPILYNIDSILSPSHFGQQAIENFLELNVAYFPLGRNEEIYRIPLHEVDVKRKALSLDKSFVVIIVNRNSTRKQLPSVLKVAKFLQNMVVPREEFAHGIKFFLHTNGIDDFGYNLQSLIDDYDIRDKFILTRDFYENSATFTPEELREVYNLAAYGKGCFLTTSGGEGFGLTILDALSCGVPVIGGNYSSMPEVIGEAGVVVDPISFFTNEEGTEFASYGIKPLAQSILHLFNHKALRTELGQKAITQAEKFNWKYDALSDMIDNVATRKNRIPQREQKGVPIDLIMVDEEMWKDNTYYPIDKVTVLSSWNPQDIDKHIRDSKSNWIALISPGTIPQRGWLSELVQLIQEDVAVVSSSCLNAQGLLVEGETKFGTNTHFFTKDGMQKANHDEEINATIFSCVLINREIYMRLEGFKPRFIESYFDLEYCLRVKQDKKRIILSERSIALKLAPSNYNMNDGKLFRQLTEVYLNRACDIVYAGPRDKIMTIYGLFSKAEVVSIPTRIAMELVTCYPHMQYASEKATPKALVQAVESSSNIMIIRNRGWGDVLMAAYFGVAPLKKANPNIHITFVTDPPYVEVTKLLPFIDEVLPYPQGLIKAKEYGYHQDLCFLPESIDPESQTPRPEIFAKHLGDYANFEYETMVLPEELIQKAQKEFTERGIGEREIVGIQTTCASPIRVYAPEYQRELIGLLIDNDFDVVLFGIDEHWRWGMENWNGDNLASFVNQTNDLCTVLAMMQTCDYFIAPDSGLMHAAGFLDIPTLALFGNINPANRVNHYRTVEVLYPEGELPCIPCGDIYNPCPECSDIESRGEFSGACMRQLFPERVLHRFLRLAGRKQNIIDKVAVEPKEVICPICGGSKFEVVNEIEHWDDEPIPTCVYVQCVNDGLIFNNPQQPNVVYEDEYFNSGKEKFYKNILEFGKIEEGETIATYVDNIFRELSA